MPWVQLRFAVTEDLAPPLAEALEECGAQSVSIESANDEPRFALADEPTTIWTRNSVTGLFSADTNPETVIRQLAGLLGGEALPPATVETLADQDWAQAWKEHYRPLAVTPGLWICPGWITPPQPAAVNILIDPGLAFGTGTHATTLLCLRWLAGRNLAGATVIDYGCGSGILAITALRLGAARAFGVDVDPVALEVSRENAGRNGVIKRLTLCAPGELRPDNGADVVLANILADPLIALADTLTALVRPGGHIVLSGMLSGQLPEVSGHYGKEFDLQQDSLDGWGILWGRKRR